MECIYSSSLLAVELRVWRGADGAIVVDCVATASFIVWNCFVAWIWVCGDYVLFFLLENRLDGGEDVAMDLPRRVGDQVGNRDSRVRCL
jgi:hypothetical protein